MVALTEQGQERAADPMVPAPWKVLSRTEEIPGTVTIEVAPGDNATTAFEPGQFNMLYAFGVGEVPVSISGRSEAGNQLHTIRRVGAVTTALTTLQPGESLGVRGPFGTSWPVMDAEGSDIIVVAGGIGLAPVRPVLCEVLTNRERFDRLYLLYGARSPDVILFQNEVQTWRRRFDTDVLVSVDAATREWRGDVGTVTQLIDRVVIHPENAHAFVCGPEIMIRFVAIELVNRGLDPDHIYVSLERSMKCGIGMCGHCQLGPYLLCRDGAVVPYSAVRDLLGIREA